MIETVCSGITKLWICDEWDFMGFVHIMYTYLMSTHTDFSWVYNAVYINHVPWFILTIKVCINITITMLNQLIYTPLLFVKQS